MKNNVLSFTLLFFAFRFSLYVFLVRARGFAPPRAFAHSVLNAARILFRHAREEN